MSESQGNKRPADRDASPARPNKISKTEAAARAAKYAVEIVEDYDPFEVLSGDIDKIIGYQSKPPDDEWTQAQEDRVIEMFQSSGMEQAGRLMYRGERSKTNYAWLLTLFKVCLRVFRLTPVELISPRYQLKYEPQGGRAKGSPHVLPAEFCKALIGLIVHPNIGADASRLLCLLQFAVICRLDIRRPWVMPLIPDKCPVLAQLRRQMKERGKGSLDEPISLTHRKLRESAGKKGENCSRLSDYLNQISELCSKETTEPDDGSYFELDSHYKPITTADVNIVVKAIESTPIEKSDYEYLVVDARKAYSEIKKGQEFPSADQLGDAWERSQKQVLRDLIQRADSRPKTPENRAPADSQEGNTGPAGSESEETSADVEMSADPEPEEGDPFVAPDIDMDEQCSEDEEEERRRQLAEEEAATSPEPESDARSSNGGPSTPAAVHRVRRRQMRMSDMAPLSPTHGSSNPYLFGTDSNELSLRRAQDRDLMRRVENSDALNHDLMEQLRDSNELNRELMKQLEVSRADNRDLMQQLEGGRDQGPDVISGLREEFQGFKAELLREQEKQSKKIDQVLQKLEEQNAKLSLLQSSSSRGAIAATLDPTTVTSPSTACSPETLVGKELPATTTDKDVQMDEPFDEEAEPETGPETGPETEPQDKADTVQQVDDLPGKTIVETNLEYGYTRPQVVVSKIGASFRCGIGSIQTRGGTGNDRPYNPLLDITHTEQVERKNRA
ncbi:hypothetical protein FAVG1_00317 [Fusarium avenaceum]|nr:hypothetical protein FAVG1_00317 [Fusarium avenaceum]